MIWKVLILGVTVFKQLGFVIAEISEMIFYCIITSLVYQQKSPNNIEIDSKMNVSQP